MNKEEINIIRRKLEGFEQVTRRLMPIKTFGVCVSHSDLISDKNLFEVNGHKEQVNSKEIERAIENIRIAKSWIARLETFYGDVEEVVIDVNAWEERNGWRELSHSKRVTFIKSSLFTIVNTVSGWFLDLTGKSNEEARNINIARTNIYNHLIEAKFQLGFELHRLVVESEKDEKDINRMLFGGVKQKP